MYERGVLLYSPVRVFVSLSASPVGLHTQVEGRESYSGRIEMISVSSQSVMTTAAVLHMLLDSWLFMGSLFLIQLVSLALLVYDHELVS